jgi:tetratricopeptide (TPR) repeat protein
MKQEARFLILASVLLCSGVCWAQRDSSVFDGKPWEDVEREIDAIEEAILGWDLATGMILSGSSMYVRRDLPAFEDITNSLCRSYAGLPPEEAEAMLRFLSEEASSQHSGLGWIQAGLCARALEKSADAASSFRQALKDTECCDLPTTYLLLGISLQETGDTEGAVSAFDRAVESAASRPTVLFQTRYRIAETLWGHSKFDRWLQVLDECAQSSNPLEKGWGLQQQAQEAWRLGEKETFAEKAGEAIVALLPFDASTEWQWRFEKERWDQLTRHLEYAGAALGGASDGMLAMDYHAAIVEISEGSMDLALRRLERWLDDYPISEVRNWDENRRLWGQRLHQVYNDMLGRMMRTDEAVAGFREMLLYATDTYHVKFEPHIYASMGYALSGADRLEEARDAYETALSLVDVPGEVIDPNVAYHPKGRMGKRARMAAVANYRNVLGRLAEKQGKQ